MNENSKLWSTFKSRYFFSRELGLGVDTSRMNFGDDFIPKFAPTVGKAIAAMAELERGAIANPDENRMVGHYWLRNSSLAPTAEMKSEIDGAVKRIKEFAQAVHSGKIAPPTGGKFQHLLLVGIGGSALGPQFVSQALSSARDPMDIFFFDNTDPDGMEKVLGQIPDLSKTLCVVVSKSGGTKETRNGQLAAKHAYEEADLDFARCFAAITGAGSELDKTAKSEGWLDSFPMWDWVGGRTSELSAVGLLPAALQGFNIDEMLRGAREFDSATRGGDLKSNPAALLAASWYHAGCGKGLKDMVILPYKDRLELFSRYLQQLVMESLGKELDLSGAKVNQGLAVYGNKGSTDQHAYVQQLRDGINNFFAVFIEVLEDGTAKSKAGGLPGRFSARDLFVEPEVTCGDYLSGFYQGTRSALYESGRESVTITVDRVNEYYVGGLIALFERAVGLYASCVNINAYHQPGVEAGKKAAAAVLAQQIKVLEILRKAGGAMTAEEAAAKLGDPSSAERVFQILRHLGANGRVKIVKAGSVFEDKYSAI